MTVLTISHSDISITQNALYGIEKMFFTKTSADKISINKEQSNSSKALYAFNPVLNTIVEIDPSQVWFWNPSWLNDELVAEKELQAGEFEEFDNIDNFIDSI